MSQQPCGAPTKRGTACRAFVPPGKSACVSHDPEMAEVVKAAQIKGGSAAAKLRMLQGKRLKLDTAAGVARFTSGVIQDCLAGTVEIDMARVILYGCGIRLKAVEMIEQAEGRRLLDQVEQLAQRARQAR